MEKTKLILDPISNGKAILLEEYVYDINGYLIRVPKSFITDGASVPHLILYNGYIILMANILMLLLCMTIYIVFTITLV